MWAVTTASSAAFSPASSVMSTAPLSARPPSARIAAAVASAVSPFTSQQIVVPPCCATPLATDAPMPEPAPITTTTLPSSRNMSAFTGAVSCPRGEPLNQAACAAGRLTAATTKNASAAATRPARLGLSQMLRIAHGCWFR